MLETHCGTKHFYCKSFGTKHCGASVRCGVVVIEIDRFLYFFVSDEKKQPKYAFLPARISRSFIICSDVNRNTSEVLLEVYDRVNKSQRFLGLGIVGIDELLANPSQRQIIPLQNRPYEEEDITGTLTVEVSKRATRGVI